MKRNRHSSEQEHLSAESEIARNNGASFESLDSPESTEDSNKKQQERPFLAALFCLISASFFTLCFMNSKIILNLWPTLSPVSLLFMRAVFSSLVMIPQALYANRKEELKARKENRQHQHLLSLSPVPMLHFCSAIFFIMYEDTLTFFMFKKLTLAEIEVFLNIG